MCEPISASAALLALGTGATLYGQHQQQQAYNKVANEQAEATRRANEQALALRQAERARQQGYQDQSNQLFNASVKNNSAETQADQEKVARETLASQYNQSADQAADVSGIPGLQQSSATDGTPRVVADAYKQMFSGVKDYLRQQAGSKAALDAYGNLSQANNAANARMLQSQGLLGNWMQGSSSALANELAANTDNSQLALATAARAGDSLVNQAALWNGLGSLGMSVGAQGLGGSLSKGGMQAPKVTGYSNGATMTSTPYFTPVKFG